MPSKSYSTNEIGIIGLGNQAKAWAKNWRDSGLNIRFFLRTNSPSHQWAKEHSYHSSNIEDIAQSKIQIFALLIPDHEHFPLLLKLEELGCIKQKVFIYGHGLSMHRFQLSQRFSETEHWLLAPKAIADQLRQYYIERGPLAAFICLKNSPDLELANETLLLLARKLGINCGPYACDFSQEALADMFSEQAVLCSTLPYVAKSAFEILLSKGIPKELAFYECFYEMKLIIDTLLKVGPEAFFQMISPNAFIGGERASKILFDDHFHVALNKLWDDLENGKCLRDMDQEMNHLGDLRAAVGRKWEGPILNEFKRFREAGHVEVKHQLKQALDHQGPAPL